MKTIDSIPTSKISRASKLVTTGAKVGVNYLKYYGDKLTKTENEARLKLNESNAEDIYDSLKTAQRKRPKSSTNVEYGKKHSTTSLCRKIFISTIFSPTIITSFGYKNF